MKQNRYTYCGDNPLYYIDPDGCSYISTLGNAGRTAFDVVKNGAVNGYMFGGAGVGVAGIRNAAKSGKLAGFMADEAGSVKFDGGSGKKNSYGKSSKKYKSTAEYLTNIESRNGKFYTDKVTIDQIGQIEARGEDISLLNKKIMSLRASTEGGTSIVYKYSDELGTKYLIHEVTDARGNIIHRDFDAIRISSGQLINKGH